MAPNSTTNYPPPLIIPPFSLSHTNNPTHTFILLHGRGPSATLFSQPLLNTTLPSTGFTLQESLPTVKFIFPTASFRRATFANRSMVRQWFDNASLDDLDFRPEVQLKGLKESIGYVHRLIEEEGKMLEEGGVERVVVGGLSLGGAVALLAGLTWSGDEKLGGVFGLASRLPLRDVLMDTLDMESEQGIGGTAKYQDEVNIVFEENDPSDPTGHLHPPVQPVDLALQALRDQLDLDPTAESASVLDIPFFLGHGVQDEKVPVDLGRQAADCLRKVGCEKVVWREYDNLGHWYHRQELEDVVEFFRTNLFDSQHSQM